MPMAEEAAKKAIQLDSLLSGPYATLAFKNMLYDLDPAQAKKYFVKALRLNPNSPQVHYWYGQYLNYYESCDRAIVEMQRAVELEPQGSYAYFNLGISLTCAAKFSLAVAALKTSAELINRTDLRLCIWGMPIWPLGNWTKHKKHMKAAQHYPMTKAWRSWFICT